MAVLESGLRAYPYAAELRRELSYRGRWYAQRHHLKFRESYGQSPVVCFLPSADESHHGNFMRESYRAIQQDAAWRGRLEKTHAQSNSSFPREERRWRELDSCNSSDALLMNIFCFPGTLRSPRIAQLFGLDHPPKADFGVRARVPLHDEKVDRTEVDMRLGDLLVEAKLTEADFQRCDREALETYRDFHEVFEVRELPLDGDMLSYQLIRNVLAAYATGLSFCVMADGRRPDLKEAWYAVMRCIRTSELRVRCKMITWQELSEELPRKLRMFLAEKYGIASGDIQAPHLTELMEAGLL
jgi:restriction endonuclease-like protein